MGTRTALLPLLLLLASCMATGGTGTPVQDGGHVPPGTGPAPGAAPTSATAASGQSGGLPAIPRKRPDGLAGSREQEASAASGSGANRGRTDRPDAASSRNAASADSGNRGRQATGSVTPPGSSKAVAPAISSSGSVAAAGSGESGRQGTGASGSVILPRPDRTVAADAASPASGTADHGGASTSGGLPDIAGAGATQQAGMPAGGANATGRRTATGGNGKTPSPGTGASSTANAGTAQVARAGTAAVTGGTPAGRKVAAGTAVSAAASTVEPEAASTVELEAASTVEPQATSPAAKEPELALVAPPAPADRGVDVESLFDGDVVRYCAAMREMGEYIGESRRRGEPFKKAIRDGVRRIAGEKQLPLDNRLSFSGQVYGRLLYRLEDSHSARTYGAYVHFACLTVRGDKKIVPADPGAERSLNEGLRRCEGRSLARDDLNDCLFRELTPIVERRNG